jgi:hypothetical protein
MGSDDSGQMIAEQATSCLGCLARYGDALRPAGVDDLTWRLQLLDELVRAGRQLAAAVGHVAGDADPSITWMVRELAAAVDLHCDRVVRAVRERPDGGSMPAVSGSSRVVPFPTPYVRTAHGPHVRADGPDDDGARRSAPSPRR